MPHCWDLRKVQFVLILCAILQEMKDFKTRVLSASSAFILERLSARWERFQAMYETATAVNEDPNALFL